MAEKSDHDMITEMYALLLGVNGQRGMCDDVKSLMKRMRIVEIVIAILLAGGGYGIAQLV